MSDDRVALRLLQAGMNPRVVAHLLELPEHDVLELARSNPNFVEHPDVDDIQTAVRALTLRIVEEIMLMLDEGSPALKQKMLPTMFGRIVQQLSAEDQSNYQQLREEMSAMMKQVTGETTGDDT